MKKTILLLCVLASLFVCSAAYAEKDFDLYIKNKVYMKKLCFPLFPFPAYLQNACDTGSEEYGVMISGFSKNVYNARMVQVRKLFGENVKRLGKLYYTFEGDIVLSRIEKDLEKVCKELPVITEQTINGEYTYTVYDGEKYAKDLYTISLFGVLRKNGRIIWYGTQSGDSQILRLRKLPLLDEKELSDGRYLVVTDDAEYYVEDQGERLVAETYVGNRTLANPKIDSPEYKILSDNVVRQSYSDGSVEHWKISLSDEDVEKNREKWRETYTLSDGHFAKYDAGDKHLLWWNGVGKCLGINNRQAMWCYHEGGEEPSAESYLEISLAKVSGVKDNNTQTANAKDETAKSGCFSGLVAKVKGFFAGLFA